MSQEALETYHSKDNYYSQDDGLENSEWQGRFSAHQGLEGTITAAEWKQACQGEDLQGNELRRKQINSRAGWDITLSASKSASLKALVHQDQTVLEAHRVAVTQTVQYIEANCIYAQVKENGILKREQTQQGQFALFEHDDNRNQEPQLHTHIVILNQTLCKDGKSRTLDSRELFNQKVTIGAYYDHAFAHQLQQNGYELEWTSDHTFEIKGYQKDQLEAFSSRRQAIREYLAQQNIRLEQATEEQKQIACLKSRPIKVHKLHPIDHEQQRERWQQESENLGIIHPHPRQDLQQLYERTAHPGSLAEVIQSALETATAYQVAVTKQTLLRDCLRHSQGHYSPIEIEQALNQSAELIATQDGRITTQRAITREQFILQSANAGQQTQTPLSQPETIEQIAQQQNLNEDQTAGLKHIATSQDFITLLQGNAGVGKTYTLSALTECLAPQQSDRLRGLAPSAAAAQVLQDEANIQSSTLERYLLSPNETLKPNEVLLIDEAGMVSSQQMERLIRKAQALDSRLILVGDIKQLSAVESGAPFRLLQERSELKTVAIEANVRQRVPHLFDAASLAAQHRTNEALKRLEHCDCIEEISDPAQRNQAVVEQYLNREPREQAQTLILCDTNQDRRDITTQIRAAYIEQDILGSEQTQISILYPKRLDRQAIAQGYHYSVGDVIRLQRPTQQYPDLYYRVLGLKDETLLLKDREGNRHEMPLHQYKEREVFDCQPLELRVGDRLRFTRNHRERNQTNGQPYTIEALNPDHTIEIRTKGQRYTVTPDQLLHSDYAYCRTVYSAQGWTSAEAIWAPGQNPGQEQTYVALTRARESLKILTLDRAALGISVEQSRTQENATDLVEPEHLYPGMDVLAQKIQERNDEKLLLESGLLEELTDLTRDLQSFIAPPSTHFYEGMDVLAQKIQERNDEKLLLESGLIEELTELTRDLQSLIAPPAQPLYEGMDALAQKIQERNDEKLLLESGLLEELTELTQDLQSLIAPPAQPLYEGMDILAQKIQERNDEKLLLESGVLEELTELTRDLQSFITPPSTHFYEGMDALAQKIQERNDEKLLLESGLLEELTELTRDLQSFITPPSTHFYEGMDALAQKIQERNDENLLVESGLVEELTELTNDLQSFISSSLEPPHPVLTEPEPQGQEPTIEANSAEAQQLTLFPGEPDEPQRKPTRRTPRQRSPQRERLHQEPSNAGQSPESTDRQTEQKEPASAADGVSAPSDIAPVRSRFAKLDELARNLRSNRPEVRSTAGASNPEREADAPVHRTDAESAPDHRELHHEPEPIFPAVPEPRDRTAATETGNPIAEATAAAINSADEPGLEPDQGIHPQAGEPIEPDSGFTQPDGNQHEDVLDLPNDGDRLDESIGDGVSRTIPERSIQPNVGADQWEGERSSDSDEQVSEAPEVEDPQVQQLQRQMAIAQSWSDDQLLAIAAEVQDYFKQPPSKPDINRAEQLHGELERLNALDRELLDRVYRQREELETLGPARSWKYLFGSNPKEVKTAEARLEQTRSEREILESRIQPIQKAFKALQQEARIYLEWRNSEKGEQMHQYRDILKLEPVQERIAQIHQAQEQIRQAQEQQRKKQEALNLLLEWKQTAIHLGRPQGYVQRIQEITEEYRKGKPLTENQIERFNQDFADYREQVRQEQAQQRNRGFSR